MDSSIPADAGLANSQFGSSGGQERGTTDLVVAGSSPVSMFLEDRQMTSTRPFHRTTIRPIGLAPRSLSIHLGPTKFSFVSTVPGIRLDLG